MERRSMQSLGPSPKPQRSRGRSAKTQPMSSHVPPTMRLTRASLEALKIDDNFNDEFLHGASTKGNTPKERTSLNETDNNGASGSKGFQSPQVYFDLENLIKTEDEIILNTDDESEIQNETVDPPLMKLEIPLAYRAVKFLRAHSKNDDPADIHTQVWQCRFEPIPEGRNATTGTVATCGGSSICFTRVNDGELLLKYTEKNNAGAKLSKPSDLLYSLAWTTIPVDHPWMKSLTILAAGGSRARVFLIHADAGVAYTVFYTVCGRSNAVISALLFHPNEPTWLFCGHDDGHIQIWDIDSPVLPSYDAFPKCLMAIETRQGFRDVLNFAFSRTHQLLLAGFDGGLLAWEVDLQKVKDKGRLTRIEFALPHTDEDGVMVDSIGLLRDDLLATKCALMGCIYVFSLTTALSRMREVNTSSASYQCEVSESDILKLQWSDSDNFYMNMGVDPVSGLLVCGDDKGALWVYNLSGYLTGDIISPLTGGPPIKQVEPTIVLHWPELEDPEVEKAKKQITKAQDIIIDNCDIYPGGDYIVAVTSTNMICIWKSAHLIRTTTTTKTTTNRKRNTRGRKRRGKTYVNKE